MELHSTIVYRSKRFAIDQVRGIDAQGRVVEKEVMRHPGAVVLLPVLEDGRIVMIRNYRVSVNRWLLELPAGTMELGEPPEVTAQRELIEETGYSARQLRLLHRFYAAPGVSDEQMHLYLATGLVAGTPHREADEEIENELLTVDQVKCKLQAGEIVDAKSLVGLLLAPSSAYSAKIL
jgi:ADP-ribose pyrophosphatase